MLEEERGRTLAGGHPVGEQHRLELLIRAILAYGPVERQERRHCLGNVMQEKRLNDTKQRDVFCPGLGRSCDRLLAAG